MDDMPEEEDGKRTDFVSAVGRAMAILECFTTPEAVAQRGRLTLTDAGRLTGLSRGTARRLLLTLSELHYVDTDGKFFWLTPKLRNLARSFLTPTNVGEGSNAILRALTEKLDDSSSVAILDGADIVYIERVERRPIFSSRIVNGTRLPAAASSIGRVLLSAMPPADLNAWLRQHPLKPFTHRTITDPSEFWSELDRVREQGYAILDEELELGIRSIAVPIQSPSGRVIAALNASTVTARHSVDNLILTFLPELRRASAELGKTMRW